MSSGSGMCASLVKENTDAACSDGCDNDGNGFVDCDDLNCGGTPSCPVEYSNPACSDGIDNDMDGQTDCADTFPMSANCSKLSACNREESNAKCSDGVDNDGDGMMDCADPDCQTEGIVVCTGNMPASPIPPMAQWKMLADAECSNGMDDDTNTFVDCNDNACKANPDVTVCHDLPNETGNASARTASTTTMTVSSTAWIRAVRRKATSSATARHRRTRR